MYASYRVVYNSTFFLDTLFNAVDNSFTTLLTKLYLSRESSTTKYIYFYKGVFLLFFLNSFYAVTCIRCSLVDSTKGWNTIFV